MNFSIIIPSFNCHETIQRSINSIIYSNKSCNVQIVLIDDCSHQAFDYLKKKYPKQDIKIIRNEINYGPGISRNIGLKNSKFENIFFLDSDDILSSNFFEEVTKISEDRDFTTIQFKSFDVIMNNDEIESKELRPSEEIPGCFTKDYLIKTVKGELPCECWQMIYKKDFLNTYKIFFKDGIHEDIAFWYEISLKSNKNIYLNKAIYKKIRSYGSIVNTLSKKHIFYYFRALNYVLEEASNYSNIFDYEIDLIVGVLDFLGSRANRIKFDTVKLVESKQELNCYLISQADIFFSKFNLDTKSAIKNAKHLSRFPLLQSWYDTNNLCS